MFVNGCGCFFLLIVDACGWLWVVVVGCGLLWMVVDGCGWLHTLV